LRFFGWGLLLLCLAVATCFVAFYRTVRAKRPAVQEPYREIDSPALLAPQRSPDWDVEDLMPDDGWRSETAREEPDILVARGILLRDVDGQERAELTTEGDLTVLRLLGPNRRTRVLLEAFADGSALHLMDGEGNSRVEIVVRDGTTRLIMNDKHHGRFFRAP
jgi:hypothetical protein